MDEAAHGAGRRLGRAVRALVLLSIAGLVAGCGIFDAPPPLAIVPPHSNLLTDPGFEDGTAGWSPSVVPIEAAALTVSAEHPRSGDQSLQIRLTAGDADEGTSSSLAVQAIGTTTFPDFISGFYRVDDWAPHAGFQYLEFVVSVHEADFDQEGQSRELRFSIGALDQPLLEPDVSYIFVSRAPPVLHKWTYFSYPVRQAFESRFARVPTHWQGIDIGVGARLDGRHPHDAPASADVLFDDIYAGPQADNPNRPPDEN